MEKTENAREALRNFSPACREMSFLNPDSLSKNKIGMTN